jgi:oligopeptide transport system substrate-binding protein
MDELDALFLWSPSEERERARQQHAGEYITAPLLATAYVGFDVSRPPFDDPRVRQAFALAADRERFADVVMQGYAFPATGGFVPPGMPGHSAGIGLPHDLERAHALLAEAGHPGGRRFPAVELLSDEVLSEHLAAQWQEDLGVEVAWVKRDWEEVLERMENDPPHIYFGAWYADYPDPDNFLRVCDGIRWTRWQNADYRQLVEEAGRVVDQRERMAMYHQADSMLVWEAVIMPVIYWRSHLLIKPWIKRFPTSAVKWWFWKDVVVEPH